MNSLFLSELAAGTSKVPASSHNEWTSLFDDVLDPSTGLPLMTHPCSAVPPLSPLGAGMSTTVPPMDSWVLEETKKLEAQQRIQQRKLLDLKQVSLLSLIYCVFLRLVLCWVLGALLGVGCLSTAARGPLSRGRRCGVVCVCVCVCVCKGMG